jgi:hypothetical protein
VIARYASHPAAGNAANDPATLPAYMALAKDAMAGADDSSLRGAQSGLKAQSNVAWGGFARR